MEKKKYISPSMYWVRIGLRKNVADDGDFDVFGGHVSNENVSRTNVWSTQESSDENEVWGQSW